MFKLTKSAFALAALFTVSALQSAHAVATLRLEVFNLSNISQGFSAITDNGAGDLFNFTTGKIQNTPTFSIGGYDLDVTGSTIPITGSPTKPNMSLHISGNFDATFVNGNYAVLTFFSDGFSTPSNTSAIASFTANVGFPFGTVSYDSFVNGSTPLTSATISSAPPGFNTTQGGTIVPTNYSLTQVVTLRAANGSGTSGASISIDANLTTVPDGGFTLSLLGGAMVGLFLIRRKQQAA